MMQATPAPAAADGDDDRLRRLLGDPGLRALVAGIGDLPPRPRIFARLQVLLRQRDVRPRQVRAVVEEDSALTANVLRLANGALFHGQAQVASIEQAVVRLGFVGLSNLVLCAEAFAGWRRQHAGGLNLDDMQEHAQRVAGITDALLAASPLREEAVLAAMLHDIGYWALAQDFRPQLWRAVELARAEDIPLHLAEARILGASHAEVGACLLDLWGLPAGVVEAVAWHHAPERAGLHRFNTLAALVVALSLSGTDDSDAFAVLARRNEVVGAGFLDGLADCPFDWAEASRRASERLVALEAAPNARQGAD